MDADILVSFSADNQDIDILHPIYEFCVSHGYHPEGEAIQVGDWPVQFIPTFSALTEEAVKESDTGEIDGVPLRVVRADHLAVIALSVGRPKDFLRILALLESGAVNTDMISQLADRHSLLGQWNGFRDKFLDD